MKSIAICAAEAADLDRQEQLLPGVSRTFALTIPELPHPLRVVVTNAYLLCRIADTIEDDSSMTPAQKAEFHQQFRAVLAAEAGATIFAETLFAQLAPDTPPAERELIQQIPAVIRCLRGFTFQQQASLRRCVEIMSKGMPEFQRTASVAGLADMREMEHYCYCVAGVVGEMLTELFCEYSKDIAQRRSELMALAVAFGQGLQMTNILKDFWEDRQRGVCWLPRGLYENNNPATFAPALQQLSVMAIEKLRQALQYTLLIPSEETGIRRFALWAIGLAILTLRNIYRQPNFRKGSEVKVSRRSVKLVILTTNLLCRQDRLLTYLFNRLARELV